MNFLIFPEAVLITVNLTVDPGLLALLQQFVDQRSDRAGAAKAVEDLKASTGALAAAIPSQPTL